MTIQDKTLQAQNTFKLIWMYKSNHLTITRAFISAFPKLRSWKDAISFRCIGSCIPRVAQRRNALLGRNASCRNNCPHPSLGTQLKEIQMVCNLSSPPLLLWRKARGGRVCLTWESRRSGSVEGGSSTYKLHNLLLLNTIQMGRSKYG